MHGAVTEFLFQGIIQKPRLY